MSDVIVLGAGPSGLLAAAALARRGVEVTVVDREPPPVGVDPAHAFERWDRRTVAQARQPHTLQARATAILRHLAPEVLDEVASHGIGTTGFLLDTVPADQREPGDDELRVLLTRRLPFELILRRVVEAQPGVRIRAATTVRGLRLDARGAVEGVSLDDGSEVGARWLVDAGGRRSPVRSLLEAAGAGPVQVRSEPCSFTYFTRHFERTPGDTRPAWTVAGARTDLGHLFVLGFPADHGTFAILLGAPSGVIPELGALRHARTWDAVARALPTVRSWVDPVAARPTTDVLVMAGQRNSLLDPCPDGTPVAPGWLPVGDALCTTNPGLGWGISLAFSHVEAAVAAISVSGSPLDGAAAYRDRVLAETTACFEVAAAGDRVRSRQLRDEDLSDDDQRFLAKEVLFRQGVAAGGAAGDLVLLRASMRRLHLLDGPDDWAEDDEVVRRATAVHLASMAAGTGPSGPSRTELVDLCRDGAAPS